MITPNRADVIPVTIANGQSLSGIVKLEWGQLLAIEISAVWTAADLTFQAASDSAGTFKDVYDDAGNEVTVKAVAGHVVTLLNAQKLSALRYIKVRSGTGATPVNQAADRALNIIVKA